MSCLPVSRVPAQRGPTQGSEEASTELCPVRKVPWLGVWHCPAGLLSYVQEGPFQTFCPSSNTLSHTGTQYQGTQSPLILTVPNSNEAVSICTLTKSPSCCPLEGQAGTAWGGHGPGGAHPADVQIPRVGNTALHQLLDNIPLTESLRARSTLPHTPHLWEMPSKTF